MLKPNSDLKAALNRRHFLQGSMGLGLFAIAGTLPSFAAEKPKDLAMKTSATEAMKAPGMFTLPPLPYPENALEPYISAKTVSFHYGKHNKAYYEKTAKAVADGPMATLSLEEIVKKTAGKTDQKSLYNNAAQAWNHTFYWNSLQPKAPDPKGKILEKINSDFGGLVKFKEKFAEVAGSHFGSGWAWLVEKDGKLDVIDTHDAGNPITMGMKPLLVVDVWEHAYYLDYQNGRAKYIEACLNHLLNWEFAEKNLT